MKLTKTICALVGAATLAGMVKGATSMAPESWTTLTPLAKVTADGALSLDGTQGPTYAFYNAVSYGDVSLEARYSAAKTDGVMAVGFVIASTDSENFIRVHYDRWNAILYRNTEGGALQEIKRAQSLGFEIANHTWTHTDLRNMDGNGVKNEIGKCANKLKEITGGQDDFLVRPPYLGVNATVQQNCGCALVNCGIDSGDWNKASTQDIYNKFMQAANNGSLNGKVLLMHENYGTTAAAVEQLCKDLPAKGYQIVSVGQMFKAKGVDMQYGTVYNQLP